MESLVNYLINTFGWNLYQLVLVNFLFYSAGILLVYNAFIKRHFVWFIYNTMKLNGKRAVFMGLCCIIFLLFLYVPIAVDIPELLNVKIIMISMATSLIFLWLIRVFVRLLHRKLHL